MGWTPASDVLADITVLEMTLARAGPSCGRQMADWGANVIKVEPPGQDGDRDFSRRHSPDFQNLHRNKRSVTINLKSEQGLAIFKEMARKADVIIENFRPDVKNRLGVDYESMRQVNPRIVYASLSAFGQDGPYGKLPGVDPIIQAIGGHMMVTGHPGGGPMRSGAAISDMMGGALLANGILLALHERQRSGEGQWVQTSLIEALIYLLDFQAARYLVEGEPPAQVGNDHPTSVPTSAYKTADGYVLLAPMNTMWERFCRALGDADMATREGFATAKERFDNRAQVNAAIEEITLTKSSAEWVEIMEAAEIPCGPINTLDQTFAHPQVRHLGVAQAVDSPKLGEIKLVGQPVHLSRTGQHMVSAAPEYGAHTDEVLKEFGYSDSDIECYRETGVI